MDDPIQQGLGEDSGEFVSSLKPASCTSPAILKPDTHKKLCSLLYSPSHRTLAASSYNSTLYRDFSLESFLFGYTGHIKIEQLIFIACCCPHLVLESLETCMKTIVEETANFCLYRSVFEVYASAREDFGLPPLEEDESWVKHTQQNYTEAILELQNEFKASRTNRIKESMRLNLLALGDKHFSVGSFLEAITFYTKSKEACSNEVQTIESWFNHLKVTATEFNYSGLASATTALESFQSVPKDKSNLSKLRVANGLIKFKQRLYIQAVHQFLEVDFAASASVSEILPPTAMVTMVVLASLAYFERRDIKNLLLGNTQFKRYLDLEPGLREIIKSFLKADYSKVICTLEERRGYFLLNLFVQEHIEHLLSGIKRRSILDYFKPYKSACLIQAAKELSTTVPVIQAELCSLISEGLLSARMDFESKVLWSKKVDPRTQVLQKVQKLGQDYQRQVRITLGLVRLQQAELK